MARLPSPRVRTSPPVRRGASNPVDLVLYISASSRYAQSPQRNCRTLLDRVDRRQVKFEICDVGEHPERAAYLSTIADAILTLDYTPSAYDMNRTMRVIKMRGSAHATHPYRLQIGAGGLHIERWTAAAHQASAEAEERWTGARS